jgi:hypothetical protein
MVRSCKKKKSIRRKKTMKGGNCGCSGSGSGFGLLKGGTKRKRISKRNKKNKKDKNLKRGGGMNLNPSPGLTELSNWARYPLNSYTNDPSDPSKLINGRFSAVSQVSPNSSISGGSRSTRRKTPKQIKCKKIKGGNIPSFVGSFGNSSNINVASNTLLGANVVNPPSFLQSASVVNAADNSPYGYSEQNPYMV